MINFLSALINCFSFVQARLKKRQLTVTIFTVFSASCTSYRPQTVGSALPAALQNSNSAFSLTTTGNSDWSGPAAKLIQPGPGQPMQILVNGKKINPIFLSLVMPSDEAGWNTFLYQLDLALTYGTPILDVFFTNIHSPERLTTLAQKLGTRSVYLWLRFDVWTPALAAFEPELLQNINGSILPDNRQAPVQSYIDSSWTTINIRTPLVAHWIQAQREQLTAFVQNANTALPGKVIGFRPTYLQTAEWYDIPRLNTPGGLAETWGFPDLTQTYFPGYSAASQSEFCAWTGMHPTLVGAGCSAPSVRTRATPDLGTAFIFAGSAEHARVPFFNRYLAMQVLQAQEQMAATIKSLTNKNALVMVNNGYLYELEVQMGSTHIALRELMNSTNIDAISSPYSYGSARQLGNPFRSMGPVDSPGLHGKIWIQEDDTRTSFNTNSSLATQTTNLGADISILRRNALASALHGNALYFFDLEGSGWFGKGTRPADSVTLWQGINSVQKSINKFDPKPAGNSLQSEVAVFIDDHSFGFHPLGGLEQSKVNISQQFISQIGSESVNELLKTGAPIRQYLLSDLYSTQLDLSRVKVAVILNAFALEDTLRAAIQSRLLVGGRMVVFQYTAGLLNDWTIAVDPDSVGSLIGMNVSMNMTPTPMAAVFRGTAYGTNSLVAPWFEVGTSASVSPLGNYIGGAADGKITMAWTALPQAQVIFSGVPIANSAIYKQILTHMKVHSYSDVLGDYVEAQGNTFFIHASKNGIRQVALPFVVDTVVEDMASGVSQVICRTCSSFQLPMNLGDTRVFRMER